MTLEGFASFVSTVAWWDDDSSYPRYRGWFVEGDTSAGNSGSAACVSAAANPHRRIGNATRFFWDLFDSTGTGTDDSTGDDENRSFTTSASIWNEFPAGTANHRRSETGNNGRNLKDFVYYDSPMYFDWELGHNCSDAQAN